MHSIWLMPDEAMQTRLSTINRGFADKWGGPVFEPHITLLGDLDCNFTQISNLCTGLFSKTSRQSAQVQSADGTDCFFTSLFLDIDLPGNFKTKRSECAEALGVQPASYRPHVSLAYGPIQTTEKSYEIGRLVKEIGGLEFDVTSIALVESSNSIPVEHWKIIWRREFLTS